MRNLSIEVASFIELCAVVYIKFLKRTNIIQQIGNDSYGFDNWSILERKDIDQCGIYITAAIDGVKKPSKASGKLSNRSTIIETKDAQKYFDLARRTNQQSVYADWNRNMKVLHRLNVVCDAVGCVKAFKTQLGKFGFLL